MYRLSREKDFIMHFLGMILLGLETLLLVISEYYLKSMYAEINILRAENYALKQKLNDLTGSQNDDPSNL